jgi:predicted transporter
LSIAAFAAGYLALWILFSALAVTAQWALECSAAMTAMMVLRSATLAGAFLIAAGLYQLTPFKNTCRIAGARRSSSPRIGAPVCGGPGAWASLTAPIASAAARR